MKVQKCLILWTLMVFFSDVFATPKNIEIWFLSEPIVGKQILNEILSPKILFSEELAIDESKCVQMGDGCFHPQLGFIPKEDLKDQKNEKEKNKPIEKKSGTKTINALETNLINCDKNYHFDIFCGKSIKNKKIVKAETEVWFDNSSSFNIIDYSKEASYCKRRVVAEKIKKICKDKVSFYVYNTHKKYVGNLAPICTHYGANSTKSLMQWIKRSKAKNLFIITDIAEMTLELSSFLDSIGAKTYGLGTMARNVNNFEDLVTNVNKLCQ